MGLTRRFALIERQKKLQKTGEMSLKAKLYCRQDLWVKFSASGGQGERIKKEVKKG
jgi:hypothetical protein